MSGKIEPYLIIARAVVEGRIGPEEFETVFLSVFRGEGDLFSDRITAALHRLFTAVDIYAADPELRERDGLDDAGLIEEASRFLRDIDNR